MIHLGRALKAPNRKWSYVKEALCAAASLGIIAILSGCLAPMATVPPGTTFENRQPRWSWTGTWRGNQSGVVFNIVQKGDEWVASGGGVSGVARLYGNRAVGRFTDGIPRTFDSVLSDDGMYAKGTVTIGGMTMEASVTRISGPPDALVNEVSQIDSDPRNAATQDEVHLAPGSGHGYLGIGIQDFPQRQVGPYAIVPGAQVPRTQAGAHQMGTFPQAPTGTSLPPPPAGYYQCYRLNVLSSANACKLGDLQLDEQGNYSSTRGPGGTYVFDPAAGVVSFGYGILNGRMALAKISNKGTYMLRMRPSGGLPSPRQTFGTYTFEHKSTGYRERW